MADIKEIYRKLGVKRAIDAHVHVELIKEDQDAGKKEFGVDPSVKSLRKEMKDNKVERAVILSEDDEENRQLIDMGLGRKKFLLALYADPSKTYSGKYMKEVDSWLKQEMFGAIKLYPGYEYFDPSEDKCKPLFKLAMQYSLPMVIHTGDTHVEAGSDLKPKVKYARPYHVDDAAVEFPDVKIVIAHAGNPWVHDAAEVAYKNTNVHVDISGWYVGKVEKRQAEMMNQNLRFLLSFCGADKILYGTDWPLVRMREYMEFVQKNMGAKRSELDKIMYGNALKVYWKGK